MQEKYSPNDIEPKAQAHWENEKAWLINVDSSREKFYACSMLPYPSGKLHMGHVRNYTINDMLARQLRMKGFNVFMPMGWDAFGLPAENAAIKNNVSPAKWTYENIDYMRGQMKALGLSIDWSKEVATCDASYYKWNQWLFLKMLEKGIAYRKTQTVNWDPVDNTVLANEQVIDGRGWRTGALIERREIPGYYLKITDYAQELLDHVQVGNEKATLTGWPDRVRLMQENWIGKSVGIRFAFLHDIKDETGKLIQDGKMYVFTTRADTIMGVTFCAVAPEHPIAEFAARGNSEVAAFIQKCQQGGNTEAEIALREKEGVPTGLFVKHPITNEQIPVWIGNYVLINYGDGAVMGVPAHDERDFAFALKYDLKIIPVVQIEGKEFDNKKWQEWYGDKIAGKAINSGELNGLGHKEAVEKIAEILSNKGLGGKQTTWRLRDWGISRQRYWGTPIPIIHCEKCGAVPVPEKDLPVKLPQDLVPDGSGNPLKNCEEFINTTCPSCNSPAKRETDTMDTFVDSSWYFMRYCDAGNNEKMVAEGTNHFMPMEQYIGGIEHAILHLLYARFWTKVMRDIGLINFDEPFKRLLTQGMVLNHIYSRKNEKGGIEYFWPQDVDLQTNPDGSQTAKLNKQIGELPAGTQIDYGGIGTMSKSKNNGIDPQDLIEKYGADTARLYTMFTAPPEATLEWSDTAVEGSFRFLKRVWAYAKKIPTKTQELEPQKLNKAAKELRYEIHSVLKQIDFDYQRMQYNTVVSGAMKMLNALEAFTINTEEDKATARESYSILLRALYPATPHIAHEIWQELGFANQLGDIATTKWPQVDEAALQKDEIQLVLQINGKARGSITVAANAAKEQIEEIAKQSPAVQERGGETAVKRIIIVAGKLVNIVIPAQ